MTLASPPDALAVNAAHLTAVMLRRVDGPEALAETLADPRFSAVALGPGLGPGAASARSCRPRSPRRRRRCSTPMR